MLEGPLGAAATIEKAADRFVENVAKAEPAEGMRREYRFGEAKFFKRLRDDFISEVMQAKMNDGKASLWVLSSVEATIVASAFHDASDAAMNRGLVDVARELFRQEQFSKMVMYWKRKRAGSLAVFALYVLWGLASRFGTSLGRWLIVGLIAIGVFGCGYMALPYLVTPTAAASPTSSSLGPFVHSFETFTLINYPTVYRYGRLEHALAVLQSALGVVYFGIGFSLLITALPTSKDR